MEVEEARSKANSKAAAKKLRLVWMFSDHETIVNHIKDVWTPYLANASSLSNAAMTTNATIVRVGEKDRRMLEDLYLPPDIPYYSLAQDLHPLLSKACRGL